MTAFSLTQRLFAPAPAIGLNGNAAPCIVPTVRYVVQNCGFLVSVEASNAAHKVVMYLVLLLLSDFRKVKKLHSKGICS